MSITLSRQIETEIIKLIPKSATLRTITSGDNNEINIRIQLDATKGSADVYDRCDALSSQLEYNKLANDALAEQLKAAQRIVHDLRKELAHEKSRIK